MIQIEHWFGLACFFLNEKYINGTTEYERFFYNFSQF